MSLFSAVKNSVRSTARSAQQTTVKVQEKVDEAPARARDTFEHAPRPKLELSSRADARGVSASLDLRLGAVSVPLARASAGVEGVTVSDGRVTAGVTAKDGTGVSTQVRGETLGIAFKSADGPATLGALDFKAGGQEFVLGIVPMAPAPTPMPVYSGPERK